MNMPVILPVELLCEGILPYLSVGDLQALDTAYTNKQLRPLLRQAWKTLQVDSFVLKFTERQVSWLCRIGVQIISLVLNELVVESVSAVTKISTLKRLQLPVCRDIVLYKLAANSPNLEELRCIGCVHGPNVDNAVSTLAQNCRQLHTLHINSDELTDDGIIGFVQHCPLLKSLHINGAQITDVGVQALCDNCPHLKHIGLCICDWLTDDSLIAIANAYPHLQSIHLQCDEFTDDGLVAIANACHHLTSFTLIESDNVETRGLTAIWAANPNLVDVDLSNNDLVFDDDIIQLVQCCPLLQKLNISRCHTLTDAAVIAVAEHCPQLTSLNISECYQMSDDSLLALGQYCHQLKSIDISELSISSVEGIEAMEAGCPLLQDIVA